jgi:hypothetical protein
MIGQPALVGFLQTSISAASYEVTATSPVPVGASVTVFAGSAATAATGVTDSQGNDYALDVSETSEQSLQSFTGILAAGVNPLAGDYWTVSYSAANTSEKTISVAAVTGVGAPDVAVAASGSSASPSVSGTAASGTEVTLACVQCAPAGGEPSYPALTGIGGGTGQQAAYGWANRAGAVTAEASITSAPWAMILLTFPALTPVALGNQSSPSGGAQLPPYPVLPDPRTWSPQDMLLTPLLRADPGNALTLLANPPLVIAGQTMTTQSIPAGEVTTVALDTELTDAWQSHTIPDRQVYPPLEGWHLAEGFAFVNDTSTGTVCTCGIQAWNNGTAYHSDGGKTSNNGVNFPIPNCADLVQVNPATDDSIALYVWQNSGAATPLASAWLKTEWVAASSGTVVNPPYPAAGWTTGATTLLQEVAAGANEILVSDPTGIVQGGVIALDSGNAAAEAVTVTSAVGQTIGISDCAYPHPASAPVAVPVSAAFMNQQVRDKINFLAYRPIARLSSQGTGQELPSQTWPAGTAITWSNPSASGYRDVDNFGGWTEFEGTQYAFPVAGTYYLYGQVYLTDVSSPVDVSAGLAITGGTIMWGDKTESAGSTSDGVCATVRRTLRVGDGDYVEVYGSQQSGGDMSVLGTAASHSRLLVVFRGF